ncbi:MAG TPA: energy transducer TonB, partial [Allosphingosinicella sp.]|nr:energy transducer TonB [Allosphingosinicella sp.]
PSGRVSDCKVTRSSGSPALDSVTCRLIVARFRYRPARDAEGRPIAETISGEHVWEVAPQPPDTWYDPVEEDAPDQP